ncbi:MAG: carboxypeptidase regulatory-like domain-containing protein [Phycisphaerales bacterium]|nr:carboxypeptidase regulatory-like domain-containing protein [Phycisphaerales bacterium]
MLRRRDIVLAFVVLLAAVARGVSAGSITGEVIDANGAPVGGACIVICDGQSGIPLERETHRPFVEGVLAGRQTTDLAFAVTNASGRFLFESVPPGAYRLIAQSWRDVPAVDGILDVNGETIVLRGVADGVRVTETWSPNVVMRPLGTGSLHIDECVGNSEVLLAISLAPTKADPILGFAGWGGPFMRNLIGGNRMPGGRTTVMGLPEGTVHLAVFASDSRPGWGAAAVEITGDAPAAMRIPIVADWSDAMHDPPPRLMPLCNEIRAEGRFSLADICRINGLEPPAAHPFERMRDIGRHLNREVALPSGAVHRFADVAAALEYIQRGWAAFDPARVGGYEEAFRDLHRVLGAEYPCFELKGIDWDAVGAELLPRARDIASDEAFGLLCMELVARLEDSHASVGRGSIDPPAPPWPQWDPGFACLIDDRGEPVVYCVDPGGPAEAAGVRVGMTIISINAVPADEAIAACMQQSSRYVGFSSERYLRYQAARWFVRQPQRGAIVTIEAHTPDGETATFEAPAMLGVRYLPRLPVPIDGVSDSADVSWTMLDDQIGYIYVRRIRDGLIASLDQAVAELGNARGLIVDVRGNSGGGFDARRAHRNFDHHDPDDPHGPHDTAEPDRPRFTGPIALLLDARCISAGEGWASWFVAHGRARSFGEATAGASSRKRTYTLTNSLFTVRFPVKAYRGFLDRPIERRGVEVDVPLRQTAADLAASRDTVLEAARRWLIEIR